MLTYITIAISVIFIIIGFLVTEENADLIAGYNAMSDEEKQKFNLKGYIAFHRKFFLFLGISTLIGTLGAIYFFDEIVGTLFLIAYPILASCYFTIKTSKFENGKNRALKRIFILSILAIILGIFVWNFMNNLTEDKLICKAKEIEITGSYGEIVPKSEIKSIELVQKYPKLILKTNGFAVGNVKKGYFKTEKGEIVKLIVNSKWTPIILITLKNDKKIYYSAENDSNKELASEIKEKLKMEQTKIGQ
ncbi:MAG: hypothetical protein CSA94_02050 [Bacteroidetes bacterium]|nr:MAG: hypothetical protein CSA94_02050 [Bacteroidota bacterium]